MGLLCGGLPLTGRDVSPCSCSAAGFSEQKMNPEVLLAVRADVTAAVSLVLNGLGSLERRFASLCGRVPDYAREFYSRSFAELR